MLIVEPMGGGLDLITQARALGFEVVLASFDGDDRQVPQASRAQVDEFLTVDTNDESALFEQVLESHARRPLTAILPGFEFYVDSVARLAERLGLPGLPVDAVQGLRDKGVMLAIARSAGLRVPRHAAASDEESLREAARAVGFPAVLKPVASAGSVHVSRVDDERQLLDAYRWMAVDTRTDLGRRLDGRVLLEEYIDGPEVSVEGYVEHGEVRVVSVTTKLLGPEPYFVEVGHIVQREMTPEARDTLTSYVTRLCRALRLNLGPFHCELRLSADEPVLIEIGARLPGGHITELIELATGVSLQRVMLATYSGLSVAKVGALGTPRVKVAALHGFTAPGLQRLRAVEGLDDLRADPEVLDVVLSVELGEDLPLADDFRARVGYAVFAADSHAAALERWQAIGREVRFV
ncbi:ATP-grasp domain-containing protein [Micromonosporaceae bacterium Da 78-11]